MNRFAHRNWDQWRLPWLLCAAASLGLVSAQVHAGQITRVASVDSIALTVDDADRSAAFFREALGFEPVSDREFVGDEIERRFGVFGARVRIIGMNLGDERIELLDFLAPRSRPMPIDSRANDGWFQHIAIITRDMDMAYAHLRAHGVEHASCGPQTLPEWNAKAAGIRAFYFRDPDGHFLEILQFPPDKGDPKWQRLSGDASRLFLGIDHTAIVVCDTAASLRFYRDQLGLRVAGASENFGTEQEHLNNVFGARLRITTLRAECGPGVELLEYLTPRDGRPMPLDTRASDVWHWHVKISSNDHYLPQQGLVSDPDGHQLLIAESN